MFKIITTYLLVILLSIPSCILENSGLSTTRRVSGNNSTLSKSNTSNDDSSQESRQSSAVGNNNASFSSSDTTLLDSILTNGKADLRNLINPFDGTFTKKITIPKNFIGYLYISGINITSLSSRVVSVRFHFGREMEAITVPATIGKAPGLTPETNIQVLILDMNNAPFKDIRLLYNLFDYNDYRDSEGNETEAPVSDPRDDQLYCRGLRLEHDHTFSPTTDDTECDELGERCLYSYAKILDSGLYREQTDDEGNTSNIAIVPSEAQIDLEGNGYKNNSMENHLKKCLPDNFNRGELSDNFNDSTIASLGMGSSFSLSILNDEGVEEDEAFIYNGPFRAIADDEWEIKTSSNTNSAIFFPPPGVDSDYYDDYPSGIFQYSGDSESLNLHSGYGSFLFPRTFIMDLQAGVEYFGSELPFGDDTSDSDLNPSSTKEIHELVSSGDSRYMYGCNSRVLNYDKYTNEGISSCNITATIEVITIEDSQEVVLTGLTDLKLQLIRPSLENYEGKEVLYSAMKTCSSSQACGSSECCFNDRCWDRSLISQCLEDVDGQGNRQVGEVCSSDYDCSSFCCNVSTGGTCAVHTNNTDEPVLCSKAPGQTCIAQDWCMIQNVSKCYIVKTGTSPTGEVECALRCFNVPTHGDCTDGICVPPAIDIPPVFDPENPNCSSAIEAPTGVGLAIGSTLEVVDTDSDSSSSSSSGSSSSDASSTTTQ